MLFTLAAENMFQKINYDPEYLWQGVSGISIQNLKQKNSFKMEIIMNYSVFAKELSDKLKRTIY